MNEWIKNILLIGAGGFAGSVLRYLVALAAAGKFHTHFPSGTLLVNVAGSFLAGVVFAGSEKYFLPPAWRLLLLTGFCGGFTTFSAFSAETFLLLKQGFAVLSAVNILLNAFLGILLFMAGYSILR